MVSLQELDRSGDIPVTVLFHRRTVPRIETFDRQSRQTFERAFQGSRVTSGKIIPSKTTVRKDSVSGDQGFLIFQVKTDASCGMSRCVQHLKRSDPLPVPNETIGPDTSGPCPEMQGEAEGLIHETGGICGMDSDLRTTETGDLLQVGGMIMVTVGQNDSFDLFSERLHIGRKNARIYQNVTNNKRISLISLPGDPAHRHAYY
jgi:hypothetical protein